MVAGTAGSESAAIVPGYTGINQESAPGTNIGNFSNPQAVVRCNMFRVKAPGKRDGFWVLQVKILRVMVLCGVFIAVIAFGAFSQTSDQELEAEEIFHEYMSPFCLGRLLADCRSDEAGELRDEIRSALARGISSESIREQLEQTYGVGIRASPKFSGWGLLAWLATPAFLAAALALVGSWIFRQRRNAANAHPYLTSTSDGADERLLKRLWEELSNGR